MHLARSRFNPATGLILVSTACSPCPTVLPEMGVDFPLAWQKRAIKGKLAVKLGFEGYTPPTSERLSFGSFFLTTRRVDPACCVCTIVWKSATKPVVAGCLWLLASIPASQVAGCDARKSIVKVVAALLPHSIPIVYKVYKINASLTTL